LEGELLLKKRRKWSLEEEEELILRKNFEEVNLWTDEVDLGEMKWK